MTQGLRSHKVPIYKRKWFCWLIWRCCNLGYSVQAIVDAIGKCSDCDTPRILRDLIALLLSEIGSYRRQYRPPALLVELIQHPRYQLLSSYFREATSLSKLAFQSELT